MEELEGVRDDWSRVEVGVVICCNLEREMDGMDDDL